MATSRQQELAAAYDLAVRELNQAADAIQNAAPDTSPADFDSLEEKFTAAENTADRARRDLELYERTTKARALASSFSRSGGADVRVTGESLTYERGNGLSFFRDLYKRSTGDIDAAQRLSRHRDEMRVERPVPEAYDLSSTDSAGGYLVPPLWANDDLVTYARPHRAGVDAIGTRPLPPNTDSINVPTIETGTATELQSSDNSAIQETDATFGVRTADVKTIAGMQDVSRQVVDRGLPGTDEVIFGDLAADLARRFDSWVITNGTSNAKGILDVSGINAVTYTDTTPTVAELYPKIADAAQRISTSIYAPANLVLMHPRRWAFFLAASDGSNRPLVVPAANNPQNAVATMTAVGAEGPVGTILGLPVVLDANIPTTLGTGTNEDRIIVVRKEELFVYEDPAGPYLEVFHDTGSGTLTVRFRCHTYVAQANARRPTAISVVSGTGLSTPSW